MDTKMAEYLESQRAFAKLMREAGNDKTKSDITRFQAICIAESTERHIAELTFILSRG